MSTKGRIFLILKTSKTGAAFLEHDFETVIKNSEAKFRKKVALETKRLNRQLTAAEFMELGSDFNQEVCETLNATTSLTD